MLFPAVALPLLLAVADRPHLPRLAALAAWPVELCVLALAGTVATAAGVLDWRFHRWGGRAISRAERRAELAALALGGVLFALLVAASLCDPRPALLLLITIVALGVAGLIAFDEQRFHRRCGRYERALHRLLVGGNGLAFLAWSHWCLARSGTLG